MSSWFEITGDYLNVSKNFKDIDKKMSEIDKKIDELGERVEKNTIRIVKLETNFKNYKKSNSAETKIMILEEFDKKQKLWALSSKGGSESPKLPE